MGRRVNARGSHKSPLRREGPSVLALDFPRSGPPIRGTPQKTRSEVPRRKRGPRSAVPRRKRGPRSFKSRLARSAVRGPRAPHRFSTGSR